MKRLRHFFSYYQDRIRQNKTSYFVYAILRTLVILTAIRSLFLHNYENFFLCLLSLFLFLLPSFFAEKFKVKIPTTFEIIIYLFIYASEILGEVNNFYTLLPGWDTMLHTLNGFLCAAIGFSLIDLLNRNSKGLNLSPIYLSLVAFCFSMTVGVLWEFFEFSLDQLAGLDTQKDFIVNQFASVSLDSTQTQQVITVPEITRTVVHSSGGHQLVIDGGYLDIGLLDTMKDLLVNFVGAVVFSIFGYLYINNKDNKQKHYIAEKLWIQSTREE